MSRVCSRSELTYVMTKASAISLSVVTYHTCTLPALTSLLSPSSVLCPLPIPSLSLVLSYPYFFLFSPLLSPLYHHPFLFFFFLNNPPPPKISPFPPPAPFPI